MRPHARAALPHGRPFVSKALFAAAVGVLLLALCASRWSTNGAATIALAQSQPSTPSGALQRLFTTDPVQSDWFSSDLLQQVPLQQAQTAVTNIHQVLGNFQSVQSQSNGLLVVFDKGSIPVQATLDSQGRFTALALGPPQFNDPLQGLRTGAAEVLSLPGTTSLLVQQNGKDIVASNTDKPLAVSSAFELAVIAALRSQVDGGTYSWDRVVALAPDWKTLPSGVLQNWPDAAPLTLATLASLMTSTSDNTAADGLITILGRPVIEALAPNNVPFPTPHEVYVLKDPANADLLSRWRSGDANAKRQVLTEADTRNDPSLSIFAGGTLLAPDVEWFFSTRELCALMGKVQDLPLMSIDTGPADRQDWSWVAYKGGFEPGAINATLWLRDKSNNSYCIAATWDGTQPVDQGQFGSAVGQIVKSLAGLGATPIPGPIEIPPLPAGAAPAPAGASPTPTPSP
jgi:beta-lactamase class A